MWKMIYIICINYSRLYATPIMWQQFQIFHISYDYLHYWNSKEHYVGIKNYKLHNICKVYKDKCFEKKIEDCVIVIMWIINLKYILYVLKLVLEFIHPLIFWTIIFLHMKQTHSVQNRISMFILLVIAICLRNLNYFPHFQNAPQVFN